MEKKFQFLYSQKLNDRLITVLFKHRRKSISNVVGTNHVAVPCLTLVNINMLLVLLDSVSTPALKSGALILIGIAVDLHMNAC
jgi:hypothetical protein